MSIDTPNTLSPEWFQTALKSLCEIEEHAAEYEDPEEGDVAPTAVVFGAVKEFLNLLNKDAEIKLETPRFFVSPAGQIVLGFGNKTRSLDIRFSPELHYYFKDATAPTKEGERAADAVALAHKHFRL